MVTIVAQAFASAARNTRQSFKSLVLTYVGALSRKARQSGLAEITSDLVGLDHIEWYGLTDEGRLFDALLRAAVNKTRLRIFYGDSLTGRDWLEEMDIFGEVAVSKGNGQTSVYLKSMVGTRQRRVPLMANNIVRLVDMDTMEVVYSHRNYHSPAMRIIYNPDRVDLNYEVEVLKPNGSFELHTRFACPDEAANYIHFMKGQDPIEPNQTL